MNVLRGKKSQETSGDFTDIFETAPTHAVELKLKTCLKSLILTHLKELTDINTISNCVFL